MATCCRIAVQHTDGTYASIYCHSDGYPEHVGAFLLKFYNDKSLALSLIGLGDMSRIGVRVKPVGPHSFDSPEEGVCVYYGRDRGEDGTDFSISDSYAELAKLADMSWAEYLYIFSDRTGWSVTSNTDIEVFEDASHIQLARHPQIDLGDDEPGTLGPRELLLYERLLLSEETSKALELLEENGEIDLMKSAHDFPLRAYRDAVITLRELRDTARRQGSYDDEAQHTA